MISRMDRDVGRIIALLESLAIDDKTLVVFTSDNGGLPSHDATFDNNGQLEGFKGSLTEGGLRVPCIARWPGRIRPGRESDEKLAFWDFMPTFAELAGIEPPAPIDGISFVPTLLDSG
jgi:arylsulfatase A